MDEKFYPGYMHGAEAMTEKAKRHRHEQTIYFYDTVLGTVWWCGECGAVCYRSKPSTAPRWRKPTGPAKKEKGR